MSETPGYFRILAAKARRLAADRALDEDTRQKLLATAILYEAKAIELSRSRSER